MARTVTTQRKMINTAAWAVGLLIFFPILWTILTSFKTEATGNREPARFSSSTGRWRTTRVVQERSDYMRFLWNSIIIAGGSTLSGYDRRGSRRLVDGLRSVQAHQGHPAVDAVDQDAAGGRCAVPDLPAVHRAWPAGHPHRAGHRADADQPADHRLDALHLFQGNPRRDPRSGAHGRRDAERGNPLRPDADGGAGHRLHDYC